MYWHNLWQQEDQRRAVMVIPSRGLVGGDVLGLHKRRQEVLKRRR